jgi:hypothetical protein
VLCRSTVNKTRVIQNMKESAATVVAEILLFYPESVKRAWLCTISVTVIVMGF